MLAMMECAHCKQACESRAMACCADCGGMVCDQCAGEGMCSDDSGEAED